MGMQQILPITVSVKKIKGVARKRWRSHSVWTDLTFVDIETGCDYIETTLSERTLECWDCNNIKHHLLLQDGRASSTRFYMLLPGHKPNNWIFVVGSERSSPTSAEALFAPGRRKKKEKLISIKTDVDSIFQVIFSFDLKSLSENISSYLIVAMRLRFGSVWTQLRDRFPAWTTKRLLIGILLFLTQTPRLACKCALLEWSGLRPSGGNVEIYGTKLHPKRNGFLPNCSFANETIHLLLVFILFKYCDYHLSFFLKELRNLKRKQTCMDLLWFLPSMRTQGV